MALRWTSSLFALLLLGLLASGCGDTSAHYAPFDGGTRQDANQTNSTEPTNQTPQGPTYSLEAVGDTEFETYLGTSVDLSVRLLSDDASVSVENERINFEIISGTNDPELRIEAGSVFVNENGVAGNRLRVGNTIGTITVRASHQWVETPLEFKISASAVPVGTLRVFTNHDRQDVFPLSDIELRLWDTNANPCSMVSYYDDFITNPMGEALLATPDSTYTFENLSIASRYTVALRAHGPQGQISGFGCMDGIEVIPDDLTDVTIPLHLLDLLATGVYDVTSFWDFSEALANSGGLGAAIVNIINWTANPGGMLADYLLDEFIGPMFCDDWNVYPDHADWLLWCQNQLLPPWDDCDVSSTCTTFRIIDAGADPRGRIGNFINEQLDNISFLANIRQMGQDLLNTISHMKVRSILTIEGKAVGEGEVRGTDRWVAMYFNWNGQEREIGVGSQTEFGALQAVWDGRIVDYNQLEIDPHEMEIPYGRVAMYFLTNSILPAVTGGNANSIGGALEHWICSGLGSIFSIPAATVQGFCRTAVNMLDLAANIFADGLTLPINLHISGLGTLVDYTSDGMADVIEEGIFTGELNSGGGTPQQMSAEFTAERQLNP